MITNMHSRLRFKRTGRTQELGASLLEVLIAILIMSFGLLALAGMTTASLQYSKIAQFQTIGVQLSVDLSDRMRANTDGFMSNSYNKTTVYSSSTAAITVPACAVATACTSSEIASIDLAQWRNALRVSMPGGDAFVQRDVSNPLAVDIWIMWTDVGLATGLSANAACPSAAVASGSSAPRCLYFRSVI
jgi:type IV pilus assembly protein PilV